MIKKITQSVKQQQNQDLQLILESVHHLKEEYENLKTYVNTQFHDLTKKFDDFSSVMNYELHDVKQKLFEAHCLNKKSEVFSGASHLNNTDSSITDEDGLSKVSQGLTNVELLAANTTGQDEDSISIARQDDLQNKNIKKTNHFSKSYQNKSFGNFNKVKKSLCTVVAIPLGQPKKNQADQTDPAFPSRNDLPEAADEFTGNKVKKILGQPKKNSVDQTSTVIPSHNDTPEAADIDQNNPYSSCQTTVALTSDDSNCTESIHETDETKDELLENVTSGSMGKKSAPSIIIPVPHSTTGDRLADYGVKFNIPETHGFYKYEEDFYTEYFSLKNIPCKVRMRLRLKKDDKIQVSALISSLKNSEFAVPISFEGNGYISAKLSGGRGYTHIWEIKYRLYRKPQLDQDFCIDAHVCLKTNRNQYNNVTYNKLVDLGYDQQKRLQFFWDFAAY